MSEPVVISQKPQKITGTALRKPKKRNPTARPPKDTPLGAVPVGWVRLLSGKPSMQLLALLDADPPQVRGGYAGWEVLPRPRRRGLTIWQGNDPISIEFAFVIDYFETAGDYTEVEKTNFCEADCRNLERMAGLDPDIRQPPYLILDGGGAIPHDYSNARKTRWVISEMSWGDVIRSGLNGKRLRQHVTLTLMQYITEGRINTSEAVKHRKKDDGIATIIAVDPKQWTGRYTVKKGDTLRSIAEKKLGDSNEWKLLAKANKIRDPKSIKVGQKLRVP